MCNTSFEAVVTSDKTVGINRHGEKVTLIAWLSQRAADIDDERYGALQTEYGDSLSIEQDGERIVIEQRVTVCSSSSLRNAKLKLASSIGAKLGVRTTIQ